MSINSKDYFEESLDTPLPALLERSRSFRREAEAHLSQKDPRKAINLLNRSFLLLDRAAEITLATYGRSRKRF